MNFGARWLELALRARSAERNEICLRIVKGLAVTLGSRTRYAFRYWRGAGNLNAYEFLIFQTCLKNLKLNLFNF